MKIPEVYKKKNYFFNLKQTQEHISGFWKHNPELWHWVQPPRPLPDFSPGPSCPLQVVKWGKGKRERRISLSLSCHAQLSVWWFQKINVFVPSWLWGTNKERDWKRPNLYEETKKFWKLIIVWNHIMNGSKPKMHHWKFQNSGEISKPSHYQNKSSTRRAGKKNKYWGKAKRAKPWTHSWDYINHSGNEQISQISHKLKHFVWGKLLERILEQTWRKSEEDMFNTHWVIIVDASPLFG